MAVIKKIDGSYGIYNEAGLQAEGSFEPNLRGLSPKELFEASLAMCITVVLQRIFERDGINLKEDEFFVEATAIKAEDKPPHFEKCIVNITFPDSFSEKYKEKLIIMAERGCTIGNTLRKGLTIYTNDATNKGK